MGKLAEYICLLTTWDDVSGGGRNIGIKRENQGKVVKTIEKTW